MKRLSGALLVAVAWNAGSVRAQSSSVMTLDNRTDRKVVRILLAPEYVSLQYKLEDTTGAETKVSISGPALGVGFLYGITKKIGFTGSARQAFSAQSNFSSMFTELAIGLSYAITGSFFRDFSEVRLGGKLVSVARDHTPGGLRFTAVANQYFLNSSNNVIGLSGVGGSLVWEMPTEREWTWFIGGRADVASNGSIVIFPIQGFAGISLWL